METLQVFADGAPLAMTAIALAVVGVEWIVLSRLARPVSHREGSSMC